MTTLQINGELLEVSADPELPLLWVLRDLLGLKGAKFGCGVGRCGACTVLIDGEAQTACTLPLGQATGHSITTVEGLAQANHPVVSAWIAEQVPQCGYCQAGQLLAAAALLVKHPSPTDTDIDRALTGVLCRCGTYPRIRRAIHRAARDLAESTPESLTVAEARAAPPDAGVTLSDFLRVHGDGSVTLVINHSEMGQGALSGLIALVAEELEIAPERIHTVFAPADRRYRNPMWNQQFTGGSSSIRGEWTPLRRDAALTRARLTAAAARRLEKPPSEFRAERGGVRHLPSDSWLSYGALAEAASREPLPEAVDLKTPAEFSVIGRPLARREIPDMVTGRTVYGIDAAVPGTLVAVVARSPGIGGRLKRFHASEALAVPGVRKVLAIESGVAVVADSFWSAQRGREALRVEWKPSRNATLSHQSIYAELYAELERNGTKVENIGNARRELRKSKNLLEASYRTPYLAHVTLEPMNCVADVGTESCEVWVGTQNQEATHTVAAKTSRMLKSKVRVHTQFLGGGFGRRLETDFVAEAVELSRRLHWPVQVIWTRADDLQHDKFRPAGAARLRAALDERGMPLAWLVRIAGSELVLDGVDIPYAIPNLRREHVEIESTVPTGPWRSVGASQNVFAIESFIDECARVADQDPYEYRRALLRHAPRHLAVLELAAEKSRWGAALRTGRGRGIATYCGFGSWIALVAEVAIKRAHITVERVVCALDCGIAVNPDAVRAQIEGGIVQGLSAALKEEVRIAEGHVQHASFEDYPILTIAEAPRIEVHIVESREPPGGAGEPAVPVIAPAVANAVFAASGLRLRQLPLRIDAAE